jgi:hypothetical protein
VNCELWRCGTDTAEYTGQSKRTVEVGLSRDRLVSSDTDSSDKDSKEEEAGEESVRDYSSGEDSTDEELTGDYWSEEALGDEEATGDDLSGDESIVSNNLTQVAFCKNNAS